jgi:hypothetical protein
MVNSRHTVFHGPATTRYLSPANRVTWRLAGQDFYGNTFLRTHSHWVSMAYPEHLSLDLGVGDTHLTPINHYPLDHRFGVPVSTPWPFRVTVTTGGTVIQIPSEFTRIEIPAARAGGLWPMMGFLTRQIDDSAWVRAPGLAARFFRNAIGWL